MYKKSVCIHCYRLYLLCYIIVAFNNGFQNYVLLKSSLSFSPVRCVEYECKQGYNYSLKLSNFLITRCKQLIILFFYIWFKISQLNLFFPCLWMGLRFFSHKINDNNRHVQCFEHWQVQVYGKLSMSISYWTLSTALFYCPILHIRKQRPREIK